MNTRALFFLLCISLLGTAKAASPKEMNETIMPVVRYYQDKKLISELPLQLVDGSRMTDASGAEWQLSVAVQPVKDRPDAQVYSLTWTLVKGEAQQTLFRIDKANIQLIHLAPNELKEIWF
jgi:hypothetical protein